MSWNVLAGSHVKPEQYEDVEPIHLDAATRRERVIEVVDELIEEHRLDVVVLQECDQELWAELSRRSTQLHTCWTPKERGHAEGLCTIVCRTSPWKLRGVSRQLYSDESGHVAQIAVVECEEEETENEDRARLQVVVGSTHVRWARPDTAVSAHIGVGQILELGGVLDAHTHSVICGDLNDEPEGPVRRALVASGWEEVSTSAPTAWIGGRGRSLDAIAVRGGSGEVIALGVEAATSLPSATCPSDHVPIAAVITWR